MANKIITTNYPKNPKQIMIADSEMISLGVQVSNAGVTAGTDGKKIVKAGTPVYGNLRTRNTGFTIAGAEGAKPAGILLHDVDVTAGTENGALVIFGVVDLEKLEMIWVDFPYSFKQSYAIAATKSSCLNIVATLKRALQTHMSLFDLIKLHKNHLIFCENKSEAKYIISDELTADLSPCDTEKITADWL